ncbi:MAG: TetR family transcriptional regulator C-terminal domain-containing protein [Marinobacter sp.]|uniref:TetR/AcrR family transcriptional regulator n=1 Tax=Marinobacter sp. TaxID=50741 RepID=UPI00299E7511|nr:TetR family transcriptional regulator C-terminal domain-containing protein [Marinobacter sp.]MDX1755621.1 TetR family transcriptional regulator C-terminal domain-containing protein [Marinobacter sp.]
MVPVNDLDMQGSETLTEADTGQQTVQYSGRKAYRAKSEQRRVQILEATLRIAAKEGIRGIKHRSVAKEAGVPLASTTYYFKDINELISDAFTLFAEKAQENLDQFYGMVNMVLDGTPPETLKRGGEGRPQLARRLAAIVTAYLGEQITHRKDEVLAEQVFLMEALRDPDLAQLARQHRTAWVSGLEYLLQRLDSQSPRRDAALLVSVVLGLGYDGLLYEGEYQAQYLSETVERMLGLVLELPVNEHGVE